MPALVRFRLDKVERQVVDPSLLVISYAVLVVNDQGGMTVVGSATDAKIRPDPAALDQVNAMFSTLESSMMQAVGLEEAADPDDFSTTPMGDSTDTEL